MPTDPTPPSPTINDIRTAAAQLEGRVVRTPLIEDEAAASILGRRVLLKAEVLQRTGTFKYRGALAFLDRLDPQTRQRGVVAYSSGNHAQGAAAAAASYGVPATIVMPADAPATKIARTKRWGAEVIPYDRATDDRQVIAEALAAEKGTAVVPPYDHPWTIAGQASLGLELAEQCRALGVEDPVVLVPAGGGGLCAAVGLALEAELPKAWVVGVEPDGWHDHVLSLAAGERTPAPKSVDSICDALLTAIPGEVTYPINERLLAGAVAVTDDEVRAAMRHAYAEAKLVVEPGGSVGLAAALTGKALGEGPIVAVLSGGNVDPATFIEAIRE